MRGTGPGADHGAGTIFVGVHEPALRRLKDPHNKTPRLRCNERAAGFPETGTHPIPRPHGLEHEIARAVVLAMLRTDTMMVLRMSGGNCPETTRNST